VTVVCAICDKLKMKVVPVAFSPALESVTDQALIHSAIEEAYRDEDVRVVITDANTTGYIHCPAYLDENGDPAAVHQGHCTGAFGIHKCPYFIGDREDASSVGWCTFKTERDRRLEAQRKVRDAVYQARKRAEEEGLIDGVYSQ